MHPEQLDRHKWIINISAIQFPEQDPYLNSKQGQKVSNILQAVLSGLSKRKLNFLIYLVLRYSDKSRFSLSIVFAAYILLL